MSLIYRIFLVDLNKLALIIVNLLEKTNGLLIYINVLDVASAPT